MIIPDTVTAYDIYIKYEGDNFLEHSNQLGQDKIQKLLLKFSLPAIVGMMVNALYNIVDRIFIGNSAGSLGIAGLTIAFPGMLIFMAFAMLVGVGATALISIKLGEQNKQEAELIMGNAFSLLIVLSLFLSIAGLIFLNPLLRIFGASDAVLPYAMEYTKIILAGTVFMALGSGMNNFIRAEGNPKIAMFTMLIGAITNTVLDPIFIFLFGWGIRGAALATIISQIISAVWVISYFLRGNSSLKIHFQNLKFNFAIIRSIVLLGIAPFTRQVAASLLHIVMNKSLYYYGGDIAISAMGIVHSISTLVFMPVFGINQGVQPIIGYNYGAKSYARVKEALRLAILSATVIVTIGFIAIMIFPNMLVGLFNHEDQELIVFSSHALRTYMILLPIVGFQIVGSNYFLAVGKSMQSLILSLSRQVLILIPLLLILPMFWGLNGILFSGPVSDVFSSAVTATWLYRDLKKLS